MAKTKMKIKKILLADEYPMLVYPALAHRIGPDAALVLQQLNFWLNNFELNSNETMNREGRWWVFNTVIEWQEKQFTWWSVRKIEVLLQDLEKMGLITTKKFYSYKWDQKKWYSINYDAVSTLAEMDIAFLDWKMPELVKHLSKLLGGKESLKASKKASNRLCSIDSPQSESLRKQNMVDDLKETKKIDKNKRLNHIDSVSGENAETDESNLETGVTSKKSKANGSASSGQNNKNSGRRETHKTQNETVASPKKKWNPSIPIGFDASGYIKLPPLKDVDPKYKAKYSATWPKVYRETQFMVVEQWIDDITIEEDEDGEVLICDKNGDWTEQEAFGQGGELPLRKLRDIAAADPYSGFSVDEYNQFIIDRFNFHWNQS